jgi:D-alanyl-D-alanine carboxypeptidase/D-alanyl-D-alanine-endopeptidase (penicillin-binding protein 4)
VRRAWLAALLLAPLLGLARELPAPVREALRRAGVPPENVAVVVQPVEGAATAVSHRADEAMNPASVMKLLTAYAGLDLLGPAFTFHTDVFAVGPLAQGVLEGDLAVRGGGDPKLTYERMWQLAHQLRSRGVREIRGDVILDRGYFMPAPHDAGRFDNDPRRAYNVGPDPLLVNYNVVDFRFIPGEDGVRVIGEPDLPDVEVASRIRLTQEPCASPRRDLRHAVEHEGAVTRVVFSGSYPAPCGERTWPLAIFDGQRNFESVFRWAWSESGGVLRGRTRLDAVPPGARLLYRHDSEPLANLVRDMNKFSNNVMARHVYLALSAENGGRGEAAASELRMRQWLKDKGIDAASLVLENGSGLSRDERASARLIASVLKSAWSSGVMAELMASMPLFGVDGTLKSRAASPGGPAHLKGGTLNGVQSIAGYVLDRHGRRWIVVMMVNHANAAAAQGALDALVEWVRAR